MNNTILLKGLRITRASTRNANAFRSKLKPLFRSRLLAILNASPKGLRPVKRQPVIRLGQNCMFWDKRKSNYNY